MVSGHLGAPGATAQEEPVELLVLYLIDLFCMFSVRDFYQEQNLLLNQGIQSIFFFRFRKIYFSGDALVKVIQLKA